MTWFAGPEGIHYFCLFVLASGWCSMIELNFEDAFRSFERLKNESRWSQCYYAYLTGGELVSHNVINCWDGLPLYALQFFLFLQYVRALQVTWMVQTEFSKKCRSCSREKTIRLSSLRSNGLVLLPCFSDSLLQTSSQMCHKSVPPLSDSCLQAERLRKISPTRELCILGVIEVLYLWKALQNCSSSKLQIMNQGESHLHHLYRQVSCSRISRHVVTSCLSLPVLQSLDECLCRGLKHLLLGAVHKCHGNVRDAVQVSIDQQYLTL